MKRLRYFFNRLKEEDLERVEEGAEGQNAGEEEYSSNEQMVRWMEEATRAIGEAKKIGELIDVQEM